jgi:hypothetical protein
MRLRYSSSLDCKSLCLDVHVPLVQVCLQALLCASVCVQHYPTGGIHATLRVLLANISLQVPVVDFVSATREHETAKASMENMCV